MRNLKRVLSLGLASVMLIGMMVMGAGAADTKKTAADLTDMDKVTNKAAVSLLVDLGVIEGKTDGSFDPTAIVDRATMTKMIFFIRMGSNDASAFVGLNTGLTDVKGNWAEGYINYCYSNNIVAGTGANTFDPAGKLTAASAAKMLLVALGYDASAQGYQNDPQWSVNITRDAQKAGLLDSVSEGAIAQLSRDSAAQMIFNALFAKTVTNTYGRDLNGNKYVVSTTQNATTLGQETYKLAKIEGVLTGISASGKAIVNGVATDLTATPDQIGSNVVYYKNSNTGKLISSSLALGKSKVLGTSTGTTSLSDLANPDKAAYIAGADTTVTYYKNGTKVDAPADLTAKTPAGTIIDLIDNDDNGKYDVVRVTVKTVATVGDDGVKITKATSTTKKDSVSISGTDLTNIAIDSIKGYEDLVKDDRILYVKLGGMYYVEKAETVVGQITGQKKIDASTTGYILGGTTYTASGLSTSTGAGVDPFNAFKDFNTDLTLYLDNNGSVIDLVLGAEAASTDYAVVLENAWTSSFANAGYGQALLLYPDATTEIVTVNKVGGKTAEKDTTAVIKGVTNGQFYAYRVDSDGKYALTAPSGSTNSAITTATITTGAAKFDGSHVGNKDTKFVVATTKDGKTTYAAYTGIANVPGTKTSSTVGGMALVNSKSGIASVVYITGGENTTGSVTQSVVYFLDTTSYTYTPESASSKGDDYFTYDAVVDGKVGTVKVAAGSKTDSFPSDGLKAVVYDNATGYITGNDGTGAVNNAKPVATGIEKANAGTIKVGNVYYTYTDDTEVFMYNKTSKEASVSSISSISKDAKAEVIAVVKDASATGTAKETTLTALYIAYTPAEGGVSGGDTATGFDVTGTAFTAGTNKVTFSANVKAKDAAATGDVKTAVTAYMLANGSWVKMNTVNDTDTMTAGATVAISTDVAGVKGTTYKFEVTITFGSETTTINSDAVMIVEG